MLQRLRNAAASMGELVQRQDRVANNLANAGTVGFQRDRAFAAALRERIDAEGAPVSTRVAGQFASREAGVLQDTGGPLHVALDGPGYFSIAGADGQARLTRAGEFVADAQGVLRTPAGHTVLGEGGGPITLPPGGGEVEISAAGEVRAAGVPVGRLAVVDVADPLALVRLDAASFAAEGLALAPSEARVRQGFLESSNVDAVREMADLIAHVRLFESQQKSLTTTDEMLGSITRQLGAF